MDDYGSFYSIDGIVILLLYFLVAHYSPLVDWIGKLLLQVVIGYGLIIMAGLSAAIFISKHDYGPAIGAGFLGLLMGIPAAIGMTPEIRRLFQKEHMDLSLIRKR